MELFIGFVVAFIISMILLCIIDEYYDIFRFVMLVVMVISLIFGFIIGIGLLGCYKSIQYINKKHNTSYTTNDYFWNSTFIKSELRKDDALQDGNYILKQNDK